MSFTVIIPARFASTRLPGKPLLDIAGKPMIQHVYEQALKSDADHVVIATDGADEHDTLEHDVVFSITVHEVVVEELDHVPLVDLLQPDVGRDVN